MISNSIKHDESYLSALAKLLFIILTGSALTFTLLYSFNNSPIDSTEKVIVLSCMFSVVGLFFSFLTILSLLNLVECRKTYTEDRYGTVSKVDKALIATNQIKVITLIPAMIKAPYKTNVMLDSKKLSDSTIEKANSLLEYHQKLPYRIINRVIYKVYRVFESLFEY